MDFEAIAKGILRFGLNTLPNKVEVNLKNIKNKILWDETPTQKDVIDSITPVYTPESYSLFENKPKKERTPSGKLVVMEFDDTIINSRVNGK